MIKKLKIRFIVLAMVSLTVLLSVIVAGMNMINYRKVVSDADTRLAVLEENSARIMLEDRLNPFSDFEDYYFDDDDSFFHGRRGPGDHYMTRDEAEESRFFMVTVDESGSVLRTYTDRISAVDAADAAVYAVNALSSGKESGFEGEFRYAVSDTSNGVLITFLDCGRTLGSFRSFLGASILMSVIGLIAVFLVMLYFAERIVRPVAESYEKQKRFITDAGHEIKTPLAIIKANVDLMDMEIDSEAENKGGESISYDMANSLRENLGDIDDQITRLTGLTNDLVYLSRMEEADNSLVMTDVPLSDIVSESIESFESLAWEKGKAIAGDIAPDVTVKGSTKELEKLMSILLENAIKYSIPPRVIDCAGDEDGMPVPPEINVILRKEGRNAVLEVCNETENELTNEMLSHVFERFYRTDSSRNSATGGHGIGLSMANAIVNAHGGKITARTDTGHDFKVTATLPLQ